MNLRTIPVRPRATQLFPTVAAIIVSYPLLSRFGEVRVAELPLQTLIGPIMLILGSALIGQLITFFLAGAHVRVLKRNFLLMVRTLAIIPVLARVPSLQVVASLSQPLVWLVGVYTLYGVARCWTQASDLLDTALQTAALTTAAFILSRLLPKVWPTGRLTFRLMAGTVSWSLSQGIVFAFIIVAACRSASLIRLTDNKLLRLIGDALRDSALLQFASATAIFIYSHDLRPVLAQRYTNRLGLMEWGAAALILALALDRLRSKMKRLPDGVTVATLSRHLQDINVTSDGELTRLSDLMTAFVEYGDRSGIATYLIAEAARLDVSVARVQQMAARIIEHSDTRAPGLTTHLDERALARRNREQRLVLLQSTVREFNEIVRTVG